MCKVILEQLIQLCMRLGGGKQWSMPTEIKQTTPMGGNAIEVKYLSVH